jgi:TIR domain
MTGFVLDHLRPALLAKGLRVRIDIDFPLGAHITREIKDACDHSAKILAVVSQNYEEGQWTNMESTYLFMSDPTQLDHRVIPIVLDNTFPIPIEFRPLKHVVFIERTNWERNIYDLITQLIQDAENQDSRPDPRQSIRTLQSNLSILSSRLSESRNVKFLNELLSQCKEQLHNEMLSFLMIPNTEFFVDNDGMLEALTAALDKHNVASIGDIPGIGKTYLAAHYSRAAIKRYSVLWISPRNRTIETPDDFIAILGEQAYLYGDPQIAGLSKADSVPWEQKLTGITELLKSQPYLIVIDDNDFIDSKRQGALYMLAQGLKLLKEACMSRLIVVSQVHCENFHQIILRAWNLETIKCFLVKRNLNEIYATQIFELSGGHPELISALCDLLDRRPISIDSGDLLNPEKYPYQVRQVMQNDLNNTLKKIFLAMSRQDHSLHTVLTTCALLDGVATDEVLDIICGLKGNRDPIRKLTEQLFIVRLRTGGLSVGKLFKNYLRTYAKIGHFESIGKYYIEHIESSIIGLIAYQGIKRLSKGEAHDLSGMIRDRLVQFFISKNQTESISYMATGEESLIYALGEFEDTPQCEQWQDLFLRISGIYLNAGSYEKSEEILHNCYRLAKDTQFIKGEVSLVSGC